MSTENLSTVNPQPKPSVALQEGWSLAIEDYAIEHQGQAVIDVEVSYDYVEGIGVLDPFEYPDFVPINDFIQNFLVNYPNETDFWEILNKNLVSSLLTQPIPTPYGVEYKLNELLDSLTVKIDIEPESSDINILRSSIVTGSPNKKETSHKKETPFSPEPLFEETKHYTTIIPANGDPADVYYPVIPDSTTIEFPIALLLQGALVDKADYANFAAQVASYGFVVVVPNHERTLTAPTGQTVTGLFPEQQQVNDVLDQMVVEDANPNSPIAEIIDTDKLGLLGHSFGGSVGLGAIQEDICVPGICSDDYTQPPELMAGIFYGTSFRNPATDNVLPVNNKDIPTGLIVGDRDGVIKPLSTEQTYDQILNPPKALITVKGANHYGITNEDNLVREPIRPTLDQATSTETIARWSALFLQAHLQGNTGAFDYIYNTGDALDQNVSVISQTQPLSALVGI